jgi:disulfide bond formation protein DsbB
MDTSNALVAFAALVGAALIPWVMQLLKKFFPCLICGVVMKRGLVALFAIVVTVGLGWWTKTLLPEVDSITRWASYGLSLFLAVEGAYQYMLKKPEDRKNEAILAEE